MILETQLRPGPLIEQVGAKFLPEFSLFEGWVPLGMIYRDDVPVDFDHVKELAHLMDLEAEARGGTGQQQTILLAEVPAYPSFRIIDGFHRVPALELRNMTEVFARIRPNTTPEELVSQRIRNARSHKEILFARIIDWVKESWGFSPWVDRLDATQAFGFRSSKTMTGRNLGFRPDEVEEIRHWVDIRCDEWQIQPTTVHSYLATAAVADPTLVKEARGRKGGSRLEVVTPDHLRVIARTLPNRHDLQRLVADYAVTHTLRTPETEILARSVIGATDIEEARAIIKEGSSHLTSRRGHREGIDDENVKPYIEALIRMGHFTASALEVVGAGMDLLNSFPAERRKSKETIYQEGDPADALALLSEGLAIPYRYDPYSRVKVSSGIVDPVSLIGTDALSGGSEYSDSVRAFTDCLVRYIPVKQLDEMLRKEPKLSALLLIMQSTLMQARHKRMYEWGTRQIPQRLAGVILDLAQRGESLPERGITQSLLAELAVCTRESVNKHLQRWMNEGLLFWDHRLGPQMVNLERIQRIYDGLF